MTANLKFKNLKIFKFKNPSDIDEMETRSIGSDISISEVDTDSSDDDNPDQINQM
jgi:hypothetical protein